MSYNRLDTKGFFEQNEVVTSRLWFQTKPTLVNTPKRINKMLDEKNDLFEELDRARDIDVEVSLLHIFSLDLLGRDSKTAVIFKARIEEE